MTLEQFLLDNLWGLITGGLALAFSVGAIHVTVRMGMKGLKRDMSDMQSKMDARDDDHDASIKALQETQGTLRERVSVVESRLDQTIKHIGEQLDRIHDKLFGK